MSKEKRDLRRTVNQRRSKALAVLAPQWRSCFWTRPFGHIRDGSRPTWSGHKDCCLYCGKPSLVSAVTDLERAALIADRWPIAQAADKREAVAS